MVRLFILLCMLLQTILVFAQNTVHLSIVEEGRGILRSRGNECFVIAPYHLVNGAESRTINITGDNQKSSTGKFIKSYPGDIAIIKVEKGANQDCSEWDILKTFTPLLKNTFEGFLEIRNEDGSIDHEPMYLKNKSDQGITIQAKDTNFQFSKGMSGSSLFSNINGVRTYLGMLLTVDESNSKVGNVFQADDMDRIISEFFEGNEEIPTNRELKKEQVISTKTIEENGFKFDLITVKKNGSKLTATFNITSLESDGRLQISTSGTKIYDTSGGNVQASNLKLSGKTDYSNVGSYFTFTKGIPIPLEVNFENAPESSGIALFELMVLYDQYKTLKFRNISFDGLEFNENSLEKIKPQSFLEDNNFRYDLLKVKRNGDQITAYFNITSLKSDGKLQISTSGTKMYDTSGGNVQASNLKLSGKTDYSNVGSYFTFTKGIPIPLEVNFENAPESSGIALFELMVLYDQYKTLKFRNITYSD